MNDNTLIKVLKNSLYKFKLSSDKQSFNYTNKNKRYKDIPLDIFFMSQSDIIQRNTENVAEFDNPNEFEEFEIDDIIDYNNMLNNLLNAVNYNDYDEYLYYEDLYDENNNYDNKLQTLIDILFYPYRHIEKQMFKEVMEKKRMPEDLYMYDDDFL